MLSTQTQYTILTRAHVLVAHNWNVCLWSSASGEGAIVPALRNTECTVQSHQSEAEHVLGRQSLMQWGAEVRTIDERRC